MDHNLTATLQYTSSMLSPSLIKTITLKISHTIHNSTCVQRYEIKGIEFEKEKWE